MRDHEAVLSPDRLARRREHLMQEIQDAPERSEWTTGPRKAAARKPRRLRTRMPRSVVGGVAVTVLALVAFIVVSVSGGEGGHGSAAFAIAPVPDGNVSIRVLDSDVSARAMTAQLHERGLHIGITALPVSPQLVGTWVGAGGTADLPAELLRSVQDQTQGYVVTLEVPASFPGSLSLAVGRAPHHGEAVAVSGARNALAPGGLLACEGLSGAEPASAAERLTELGYTVEWSTGPTGNQSLPAAPPGTRVTEAIVEDDEPHVRLVVASPSDERSYDAQRWRGFAPSQRLAGASGIDCGMRP